MMDKERKAALDAFDNVIKNCWSSISLYMSRADIPVIRASLATSPAPMPSAEVDDAVKKFDEHIKGLYGGELNPYFYVLRNAAQASSAIAAENERYKTALEKLARLGAGDRYGNSDGNIIAQQALTQPGEKS